MTQSGFDQSGATRAKDFATLVADQIPDLYRYARWVVGDATEAEDVVGETVVRALERSEQFRSEASLRTWLHQILHNLAIDRSRHSSHEVVVSEIEERWGDERFSVDAAIVLERAETRAELEDALLHVPFHYRSVVVLHDAQDWKIDEVAKLLEIGHSAAKQRLRRGRMMLVEALAHGEDRRMANEGVVLTCSEARARVSDYIDDELDARDRVALESHLASCVTCPPLYSALVGVKGSLGEFHDSNSVIAPDLLRRVRQRIDDVHAGRKALDN
ncbi:MAG: sigma-70 family RNA polymerase sigma factor [Acidimicrobiaceae bacterium]|nr:sigma-70 family RNA polymerase sigma factor [Acidimicrobiaceae bacterium]